MLLKNLFDIINGYPSSQVIVKEQKEDNHIPYIRPSSDYQKVVAGYVDRKTIPERYIFPPETIFVSTDGQGSHTYSYVSNFSFVPNSNVVVLLPKKEMSLQEKIFYSLCITKNRYKFSYGRKPKGDRLANVILPDEIPDWVNKRSINNVKEPVINKTVPELNINAWQDFTYSDLFDVKKGKRVKMTEISDPNGKYNFVSAMKTNNSVSCKTNLKPLFPGNVITVNYDGNGGVGYAFYQPKPFWALDSVNVLIPKFNLNPYIAMFLITLIRKERYRYNYGRKWHKERMEKSILKLPVDNNGNPDWVFMEEYIKTLSYSNALVRG